jgi:hypothetical protein
MLIIFNKHSKPAAYNKTIFHLDELVYLKKNFHSFPAKVLLNHINSLRTDKIKLTVFRNKCTQLGLKKHDRPDLWLPREERFLINNYRIMGNVDICSHLNKFKNRSRNFTVKHVWKKMKLMKLHRSEKELKQIRLNNISAGMYAKNQHIAAAVRRYPEGKMVIRRDVTGRKHKWIKQGEKMVQLQRVVWEQNFGFIPEGFKIYHKDGDSLNCRPENLVCRKGYIHRFRKLVIPDADVFLNKETAKPSHYYPVVPFRNPQATSINY